MAFWMYAIDEEGKTIEYKGDSGSMSTALEADMEAMKFTGVVKHYSEPIIGHCMRVGSPYGRSYSAQDYWTTTPVLEIVSRVEDTDGYTTVIFKTKNSTYKWVG